MDRIKFQGFGPIGVGWMSLSPLTILIGPNGCGKSYAGMALHSLVKDDRRFRAFDDNLQSSLDENELEALEDISGELEENEQANMPPEIANAVIEEYLDQVVREQFQESLEDTFAVRLWELITVDRDKIVFIFETKLGNVKLGYYKGWGEIRVEEYPRIDDHIVLKFRDLDITENIVLAGEDNIIFRLPEGFFRYHRSPNNLVSALEFCIGAQIFGRSYTDSYYLPAPRAGFLESHDVLSAGAFNRLSRAGIEPIEVPAFSGAVSNYLSQVANISQSDDEGKLSHIAHEFEQDVFDGEVKIEESEQGPQSDISFSQYGREFPFYLTSTGISELAPLSLFTKYKLSGTSMMIIEEPEAHLHPENQRKVAFYIAKLVNEGVRIVVTTHSDFFLEQLNNLIRLSQIQEDKIKQAELGHLPPLHPDDVSVNMFYSDGKIEYKTEELEIDGVDGIPMDQFEEVADELYGEAYQVDELLREELRNSE
jgi:predicted ATPase